jgi:hypothetical protein
MHTDLIDFKVKLNYFIFVRKFVKLSNPEKPLELAHSNQNIALLRKIHSRKRFLEIFIRK